MEGNKGRLIVISGPSGVGKGTVIKGLLEKRPDIVKSVSVTTRAPREGEKEGVNYFFCSPQEYFEIKQSGGFLETFEIYGNYYGTPVKFIEDTLNSGKDVLLELDVQGALEVKRLMPAARLIFIAPPSIEHVKERLKNRNTEDEHSFNKRVSAAQAEIDLSQNYHYIVVNDCIGRAVEELAAIIAKL